MLEPFDRDFTTAFAHVFAFNYRSAAEHFGVSVKTIQRWLDTNTAPRYVVRHLHVLSRGWLPDYEPFISWQIDGTNIITPFGTVNAFEVEFLHSYKWNARALADQFKYRNLLPVINLPTQAANDNAINNFYGKRVANYGG